MSYLRWIGVWVCLLLLSGCLPRMTTEQLEDIKTVAVVSIMGDSLYGAYRGTTIFQRENFSTNIESWRINKIVEDITENYLNNCSSYKVMMMPHDSRALFLEYIKGKKESLQPEYDFDQIKARVDEIATLHGVDAVVLILEHYHIAFDTYDSHRGIQLYRRSFLGIAGTYPLVVSQVGILDVKLNKYVMQMPYLEDFKPFSDSLVELESLDWKDSFDLYSEYEMAFIKEQVEQKFRLQVHRSLRDMEFISSTNANCSAPN